MGTQTKYNMQAARKDKTILLRFEKKKKTHYYSNFYAFTLVRSSLIV